MTTITLEGRSLEALSGTLDENFRYLTERLGVRLAARGDTVSLDGEPVAVERAQKVLEGLARLVASGYAVGKQEFRTALRVLEEDPGVDLVEFFTDASIPAAVKRLLVPRNLKQRLFIQAVSRFDIVFAVGPAGTGKTYLAV
ncbi:MAG: PhoH family protein, partial [Acidobacteriota bacterium]